ncbi:hypothetical protein JD844_008145 [Phrynosoma platyrhinos]|uniref:Ysc84 actin-binding domain-containing protein n=1 Tax=Phrynosoma platyrhinos TaxID=52577 RepID=A0ABQ7TDP9_PHRPL|nr:hypothetical protein JD844_008145 [Phrynosoma platyrhinos]
MLEEAVGSWSAPSVIGIAGLDGGFEIEIEVSDLVIILNHERAVEAFAKGGNLTLGGNFTVAIGTLGRNLEGDVALRSSAAVYTYCKSRGLFAGVSLEGSCLIERKETNSKFYGWDIRASAILFGDVPPPLQAQDLYDILEPFTLQYKCYEGRNYVWTPVQREPRKVNDYSSRQQSCRTSENFIPEELRALNRLYPELPSYSASMGNSHTNPTTMKAIYPFEGQQLGDLTWRQNRGHNKNRSPV